MGARKSTIAKMTGDWLGSGWIYGSDIKEYYIRRGTRCSKVGIRNSWIVSSKIRKSARGNFG